MELMLRCIELLELCRSEFYDPFFTNMELRCLEEIGILLRYNHNHDPHTGRFTSGDSVNTVDKSEKSDIIKTGSDDVAEIIELGKFDTQPLEIEFGKLKTDELIVTNERIEHIKSRHPEDFNLFEKYSTEDSKMQQKIPRQSGIFPPHRGRFKRRSRIPDTAGIHLWPRWPPWHSRHTSYLSGLHLS